jgi:hypothetical protein
MLFQPTITTLGAFAVTVSGLTISPQPATVEVTPRADDESLQTRANVQFSLGYTLCTWTVSDPWGGQGGSYTDILVAAGDKEIGCVEMDSSPHVPANGYDEGNFFNIWNVCGMDINFYEKNGNWDFYENGGDGTLLVSFDTYPITPYFILLSDSRPIKSRKKE